MSIILSLFDYTGEAVRPWAEAGHTCYCLDVQHDPDLGFSAGRIIKRHADLSDIYCANRALTNIFGEDWANKIDFVLGWPPCTDLAGSGARHWARKRQADPAFQDRAVRMAQVVQWVGTMAECPWVLENPVGALSTLWRKPDHMFDPCDYGGYIPESEAEHPTWPEYIPPRDAYRKRTCYWVGGGFRMPEAKPVEPEVLTDNAGNRGSRQWKKLGGKSLRTKNIRSATPRGIAKAIFKVNGE